MATGGRGPPVRGRWLAQISFLALPFLHGDWQVRALFFDDRQPDLGFPRYRFVLDLKPLMRQQVAPVAGLQATHGYAAYAYALHGHYGQSHTLAKVGNLAGALAL